ncbi:hypothetical protein [Sorangium sp. So ce1182]|uniref:hypothetical protein n=1 Tax=Sorangium sp. So ce1182 TaxID=3133334 RepID=UPI003F64846F
MNTSSKHRIAMALALLALPVLTGARGNGCNDPVVIGGDGGSGAGSGGGDDSPACPGFERLATPEELALTPMDDPGAEVLAREATQSFIAPLDVYERVKRDLAAIHAMEPDLANISGAHRSLVELGISWTEAGKAAIDAGTYHAWDCLNEYYGATSFTNFDRTPVTFLQFAGNFDMEMLAREYAKLPEVESTDAAGLSGDGSTACLSIDGEEYRYILDLASGEDCIAGCSDHLYFGFSTTPDGTVTPLGSHASSDSAVPAWFTELEDCRSRLH